MDNPSAVSIPGEPPALALVAGGLIVGVILLVVFAANHRGRLARLRWWWWFIGVLWIVCGNAIVVWPDFTNFFAPTFGALWTLAVVGIFPEYVVLLLVDEPKEDGESQALIIDQLIRGYVRGGASQTEINRLIDGQELPAVQREQLKRFHRSERRLPH